MAETSNSNLSETTLLPESEDSSDGWRTPSIPTVDDDNTDVDDGVLSTSATTSIRSNFYEHVEENGRTYHRYKEGKYPLPNDEQEQERLHVQHTLFCVTLNGKLHLAPVSPDIRHVLDFATGTGVWAIDFAQQFPSAEILGTDLSAIQPTVVPPNVRFEIDDAEDEWVFNEQFDYIHGRALLSCFKDPKSVFQQAFDALSPGGYLELQDGIFPFKYIGDVPTESALYKWDELVTAGAAKLGRPWTNAQYYKRWLEEIGFQDVVEKRFYWPTSAWAKGAYYKTVAAWWQADILHGLEAISLKVMGLMGWEPEKTREFLEEVRADMKNTDIHGYLTIVIVYGRKAL